MALGRDEPVVLTPDYHLAWLLKRTLGGTVLAANSSSPAVRVYAYAGRAPSPWAARAECGAGGVQLLLMNLAAAPVAVALPPAAGAAFAAWTLTPRGGDAFAAAADLNGVPLPSLLDSAAAAAALGAIAVPPVTGRVADGVTVGGWGLAVVCVR